MLIPVQGRPGGGGLQEWALVELQGVIDAKEGEDGEPTLDVGTLVVPADVRAPRRAAPAAGRCRRCVLALNGSFHL
jgi:hypothetical protein